MAIVRTLLGYVKGPKGDTGETGATGATGAAATVEAGTVNTVAYGQPAHVTNVGTPQAAVFNFDIPEGRPGNIGEISGYPVNAITTQAGDFPIPNVGDTIASIVGKQAKATADARDGIQSALDAAAAASASIANVLGDFADVEATATASKAYEVGDYLVLNGQFYKVTAAIAQGNALTVDGNIEATNVGAEVASIKSDLSNFLKLKSMTIRGTTNQNGDYTLPVPASQVVGISASVGETIFTVRFGTANNGVARVYTPAFVARINFAFSAVMFYVENT